MATKSEINQFFESFERLILKIQEVDSSCVAMSQDITKQGLSIVGFVGDKGQVIMRDIAIHFDIPFSTATGIIDRLVELNYVNRFNSTEDRRIVLVELTGKGKDLHDLFGTKKVELGHLVLNQLNKEERQNFIGLLNKVKQGVAKPL
ncbi:MAG: MarR family transcriptional regulator [Bacteroidota bacterium]